MPHTLTRSQRATLAQALRDRMQTMQTQLQGHLQGRSLAEKALAAREQDGNDAQQFASDQEVGNTLTNLERRELAALAAALQRVDGADYGLCAACGKRIPYERLLIEPHTLRCVACEALREAKQAG